MLKKFLSTLENFFALSNPGEKANGKLTLSFFSKWALRVDRVETGKGWGTLFLGPWPLRMIF
jgi:hypothetical protein